MGICACVHVYMCVHASDSIYACVCMYVCVHVRLCALAYFFFLVAQLVQWNLTGDQYAVAFEKTIAVYEATVSVSLLCY